MSDVASLAAFRDGRSKHLRSLAEEHMQHEYVTWPIRITVRADKC